MTSLMDPSYAYDGIPAVEMREILNLITQFDRKSFNIKREGDTRVNGSDPYAFYWSLLIKHDLVRKLDEGGYDLTPLGIELVMASFREPVSRDVAKVEIENLKNRAAWIIDDPDHLYYIRGIFIFGSYVDSQKPLLGDLDVGVSIGMKSEFMKMSEDQRLNLSRANYARVVPIENRKDDVDFMDWERENMLSALLNNQPFISFHLSTEVPDLRVKNVLWVYDSHKSLSSHAVLDKVQMKMVNSYLRKTA